MKYIKYVLAAVSAFAVNAYAFHSGGVAECEGCHTMHNSFENRPMEAEGVGRAIGPALGLQQFQAGPYLLKGSDQSSACLNCHNGKDTAPSSYHVSTDSSMLAPGVPPANMTPGGDFGWLKKTYSFIVRGSTVVNEGDRHGHNIIATDYGYEQDAVQTVAPGGLGYPASKLYCSSCHDPHGKYRRDSNNVVSTTGLPIFNSGSYGSSANPIPGVSAVGVYRFLGGIGYQPKSVVGSFAFMNPPPIAVVNSTYNRSEANGQTHVAYGQGMSEWCANCHPAMHMNNYVSGTPKLVHPAGNGAKFTSEIAVNYNSYVTSGIMTNTDPLKAYSSLAPFESGEDYSAINSLKAKAVNTDTVNMSASTNSNVMCLSCHRAHASGFASMTRWFMENEFMTIADANNNAIYDTTNTTRSYGYSEAEQQAAYYGRPASVFGPYARVYCNKCHAKD